MPTVRGSMPDAIKGDEWILIKGCTKLFLTYQIKLLTFLASKNSKLLKIIINQNCEISKSLSEFLLKYKNYVCIERVN